MPSTPKKSFEMRNSSSTASVLSDSNANNKQQAQQFLQWSCTKCTFLNHPALRNCEECELPRFNLDSTGDNSSIAAAADSSQCFCHDSADQAEKQELKQKNRET